MYFRAHMNLILFEGWVSIMQLVKTKQNFKCYLTGGWSTLPILRTTVVSVVTEEEPISMQSLIFPSISVLYTFHSRTIRVICSSLNIDVKLLVFALLISVPINCRSSWQSSIYWHRNYYSWHFLLNHVVSQFWCKRKDLYFIVLSVPFSHWEHVGLLWAWVDPLYAQYFRIYYTKLEIRWTSYDETYNLSPSWPEIQNILQQYPEHQLLHLEK